MACIAPVVTFTKQLVHKTWCEYCCFSSDASCLATASANEITLWRLSDETILSCLKHDDNVWKCAFSKDQSKLFSVTSTGYLCTWDLKCFLQVNCISAHPDCVFGCSTNESNDLIATGSCDNSIKLFNQNTGQKVLTLVGHHNSVEDVTFSPDGAVLASCSKDKTICIWKNYLQKDNLDCSLLLGHRGWVFSCAFSQDGNQLASASADRTVRVWSVLDCRVLHILRSHTNVVWSCCFIEPGILTSCSSDKTVR